VTDLEFEKTLRTVAARTVDLTPSTAQCARLLERRRRGERVRIPAQAEWKRRPWGSRITAMAAIAAGLGAIVVASFRNASRREDEGRPHPPPALLIPGPLMAQPTSRPAFPVLASLSGRRLRPVRWTYTADLTRTARPADTLFVYTLLPTTYRGSEAWLALAGMQVEGRLPAYSDSTWLSRERLDVLGHRRDTLVTWQPVVSTVLTILQAAALDSAWAVSVPMPGTVRDRQDGRSWMNLKVYGRETIEVPAGRCTCWKVGFRPSLGFFLWVDQEGVTVRQGMGRVDDYAFGKMNLGLLRTEEP
jgi:hypothetical protein